MSGPRPIAERLSERIEERDSCWIWTGAQHGNGYGEVWCNNRRQYVHRVAFETFIRPLAPGEVVCHHCDTPLCIKPDHLFAGTQADNMRDMHHKGRARGLFCSPENPHWRSRKDSAA